MRKSPNIEFLFLSILLALLWAATVTLVALDSAGVWQLPAAEWLRVALFALPVFGMHVLVFHYLRRTDEFMRAIAAKNFILTTLIVLSTTMVYGIAQLVAEVPAVSMYWVAPVFWSVYVVLTFLVRGSRFSASE
ncbi:MAG: hypothetical protein ABL973_04580 [Micropepsaceae bacterium]